MIRAENINYIYSSPSQKNHALHNISLTIPDGSINAIIGHTGSGKSTLIKHFNALLKPSSGKIFIDATEITSGKIKLSDIRKRVGLVFQYPEHQLFEETVEKDIAFGPKSLNLTDIEINERVKEAAALVGLNKELLKKSPFELSGGEKRRAAIAGVLAMKPEILIFDEPTAGLDPKGRDEISELIKKLHRENEKMIIIFVSHSMEDVAKTADNVFVMNEGNLYMQGTVGEVFSRVNELKKIGLDVPQITDLCLNLKNMGFNINDDIYTVDTAAEAILKLLNGD